MRISDWSSDVCSSDLGIPSVPTRCRRAWRAHRARRRPPRCNDIGIEPKKRFFAKMNGFICSLRSRGDSGAVRPRSTQAGEEPQKSPCIGRGFFVKNADQARALILAARRDLWRAALFLRSEEHTSELQSLMRLSYASF